jgi:hypothetical protein
MSRRWVAVPFGLAFGFLLSWAHLTDAAAIRAMLMLEEWDGFLVMGSAMTVGFVGAHLLRAAKARALVGGEAIAWVRTRPARNHVFGSVLFGLGWSLACTCPGPMSAQLGMGRFGALAVVIGVLGGIALRARLSAPRATAAVTGGAATAGL